MMEINKNLLVFTMWYKYSAFTRYDALNTTMNSTTQALQVNCHKP